MWDAKWDDLTWLDIKSLFLYTFYTDLYKKNKKQMQVVEKLGYAAVSRIVVSSLFGSKSRLMSRLMTGFRQCCPSWYVIFE